eukprot:4198918-Pyramimonas_sp.AAC.1
MLHSQQVRHLWEASPAERDSSHGRRSCPPDVLGEFCKYLKTARGGSQCRVWKSVTARSRVARKFGSSL